VIPSALVRVFRRRGAVVRVGLATERQVTVVVVAARPCGRGRLGRCHVRGRGEVPLDVEGEVDVGRNLPAGVSLLEPAVARGVGVSDAIRVSIAHAGAAEERLGSDVVEIATVVVGVAGQLVLGLAAGRDVHGSMIVDVLLAFGLGGRVGCKCRLKQSQEAQRAREYRANHGVRVQLERGKWEKRVKKAETKLKERKCINT
jgi:hypothetical protein